MKKIIKLLFDNTIRILSERINSFIVVLSLLPNEKALYFEKTNSSKFHILLARFFTNVARFSVDKRPVEKQVKFFVRDKSFKMSLNINEYTQCCYYFSFPSESLIKLIDFGGDTFIDVGANVGFFSIYASKMFKNVIAFEPTRCSIDSLKRNLHINKIENLFLYELALSNKSGKSMFYENPLNQGGNSLEKIDLGKKKIQTKDRLEYEVEVKKLDDLQILEMEDLGNIELIKLDVEGHEARVLEGANNLLMRNKPMIFAEIGRSLENHNKILNYLPQCYIAVDPNTLSIVEDSSHLPWDVLYLTPTKLEQLKK